MGRMNKRRNMIPFLVAALVIVILIGWTIWQNARFTHRIDTSRKATVMLDGEYSIDDGPWLSIDNSKPIEKTFHKAVFKGHLSPTVNSRSTNAMYIISKNVWYTIYDEEGQIIEEYRRTPGDLDGTGYMAEKLPQTPGYFFMEEFVHLDTKFQYEGEVTLVVEYAYDLKTETFSDCFYVVTGFSDGIYIRFFYDILPSLIVFLLVCFFGAFFFPIASGLLGRVDFRYVAFGMLCFFAGLFMVIHRTSGYMNLWIEDPAVCMMTEKIAICLFVVSALVYLRSILFEKIGKIISNILVFIYTVLTIVCVILHASGRADMMETSGVRYLFVIFFAVILTVLLCLEIRGKKGRMLLKYLLAWVPFGISLILDIIDFYADIPGTKFLRYGLAITILYQFVRFAIDFRKQYKEAIRYQQVQKELYEAKVNVMVSQIRPHFMYNALSSIAMLCKIDPDTAYDATIAFSDYLRGNMDSLKQTAPVPFTTELEHLKKYLYIEKLRFDDKLNIEYDIKDTNFELPLLSIQPIVENAVKHGVGMKEDGGTVKISTRETETSHEVIIEDDGVGFDVNEKKDDGRTHVGMENTKKRIGEMCGGEVIITSEIGKGTVAKVIILKKEEHDT